MNLTENLKLKKPGQNDLVNIDDLNSNSDILDEAAAAFGRGLEEQSKSNLALNDFNKTIMMVHTGFHKKMIYSPREANIQLNDNVLKIQPTSFAGRTILKSPVVTNKLHAKIDMLESSTLKGFNIVGVNENGVQKTAPVWVTPKLNEIVLESDEPLHGIALNITNAKTFVDINAESTIWGNEDVLNVHSHFGWLDIMTGDIVQINDLVSKQSQSNLVLVTTMQKLLSEKIEELEREKERADYFGRNLVTVWNDTSKKGTAYTSLGYMEDIKSEEEGIVFVKMRADIASWTDKKLRIVTGPTKYFDITKDGEHVFETVLTPNSNQYLLYSGMQKSDSEKNIVEWEQISVIRKSEYKGMFVFTRPYSLILEELDFYKSQLEKLKLTQEVDLNLLLTL